MNYFKAFSLLLVVILLSCTNRDTLVGDGPKLNIPDGFEIEDLYSPSSAGQGSWVSITEGPDNRFYACDQYGAIYTFEMPPVGQVLDSNDVRAVDLNMGYAQGLLWAFNSLYVVVVKGVDEERPDDPSTGVYRLKDENGDGQLDQINHLLSLDGQGEHGPHTLRVSPDGKSLYFIAGNFNTIPDHFKSRLPKTWGEDNLFPPYLDAQGHATDLKAPGGWLAKTDPDGKEWEIIGAGMRNPFSFGINEEGDLFAYDADMEWDFGMPWYRPTRILHVTSGSEFGWRTGSGKWPVYYPDNLPAVENMAQGSPTAVIMGKDLNFPSRFKKGLFACDWSFGTIFYVDIREEGSSYIGEREEFLSGVPLPISNAVAGSDGHLYFLTGGRRLKSHLYRVRYTGEPSEEESAMVETDTDARDLRDLRRSLEAFHGIRSVDAIEKSWPYLDHEDQFIRYAARIAIEHQPLPSWVNRLWKEESASKIMYAAIAYARSGGPISSRILNKLGSVDWNSLTKEDKISLLRAYSLLLIRQGEPSSEVARHIGIRLSPYFPSDDTQLNRELGQILLYVKSPDAVEKCMAILDRESEKATASHPELLSDELLDRSEQYGPQIADMVANMPPTEAIYYVTILSHATVGWTKELREDYFDWFYRALSKKGGVSYKGFLDNIRAKALKNVPPEEYEYFRERSGFYSPIQELADRPQPIGPGKEYNYFDVARIVVWGNENFQNYTGSYEDGKRAYEAALCGACHRIKGEGGASGPDLTNVNTRFDRGAIASAIMSPSEEISDQYAFTIYHLKDGSQIVGRMVEETENSYKIFQSPYDMTQTIEVKKSDVERLELSPLSPMPAKLLDPLNEQEIKDLFIYLLSGADAEHESYQ